MNSYFIAHARSLEGPALDETVVAIVRACPDAFGKVTLGRDDYIEHFKSAGSWNNWAAGVVQRHTHIIVPFGDGQIGRATGQIIEYALSLAKPVFVLWTDETLKRVTRIARNYAGNAQDWWNLEVAP